MGIPTRVGEIISIPKKIKDAGPVDSHHAPEWKERQRSRMEGLRSRLLMWRLSPESMRDDLENIYVLLFRFVGNGFQLALWTRESVVLVPDPIFFAPWSVLLDRGEPCDSCQDTPRVVVLCFLGPTPDHKQVYRKGDLVETTKYWMLQELEWEDRQKNRAEEHGTNHDTTKLRRDDDGGPKRGALYGSHRKVFPYRVKVCFYCVTSLAVLSRGSAVG